MERPFFRKGLVCVLVASGYFIFPFVRFLLIKTGVTSASCGSVFGRPYVPNCDAESWLSERLAIYVADFKTTGLMVCALIGGIGGMKYSRPLNSEGSDGG